MAGLIEGLFTPSSEIEDDYTFFLVAFGHLGFGAALCQLTGWVLPIPVLYWVLKERRDLRLGGSFWDGIIDAGFVGVGAAAFMASLPIWAWFIIAVGGTLIRSGVRRRLLKQDNVPE